MRSYNKNHLPAVLLSLSLAACGGSGGGGGGDSDGSSSPSTNNDPVAETAEAAAAFTLLNQLRVASGADALLNNGLLTQAAQNHANYLVFNDEFSHDETAGQSFFSGADLGDRIDAVGYPFEVAGEDLTAGQAFSGVESIDLLFAALYHRLSLLGTFWVDAGSAFASDTQGAVLNAHVINLGIRDLNTQLNSLADDLTIVYPYSNQTDVPVDFFSDQEVPDPVTTTNQVGYPISLQIHPAHLLSVSSFRLYRGGGSGSGGVEITNVQRMSRVAAADEVQTCIGTLPVVCDDGYLAQNEAALIPLVTLQANTSYTVEFSGSDFDGSTTTPFSATWSFTTAP